MTRSSRFIALKISPKKMIKKSLCICKLKHISQRMWRELAQSSQHGSIIRVNFCPCCPGFIALFPHEVFSDLSTSLDNSSSLRQILGDFCFISCRIFYAKAKLPTIIPTRCLRNIGVCEKCINTCF